ncbi:MAG: hypothetical protein HYR56_20785 [Acidobacteria bacterium]|nr:hypothetical protein [Acidobacteriota bacterium]MBI3425904.1 hypothetical protein [Acidobacteriota bacterium]
MSTAIQTLPLPLSPAPAGVTVPADILPFPWAAERQLRRAYEQVAWLQAEVHELRQALEQANRLQMQQSVLLRNARRRELALRASLPTGG